MSTIAGYFCLSAIAPITTLNMGDFPADLPADTHILWSLQDQFVKVRGFWYPISSNQGVLASHPSLKSCCLATPANLRQQLVVKGQLGSLPAQRVVTLTGIFKIEPVYNKEGELVQFYVLEQAQEVQQANSYLLFLIVGFLLGVLGIYSFYLNMRNLGRVKASGLKNRVESHIDLI